MLAIHEATVEALKRVRAGSGPVFLEAMTYRFRGHSVADPSVYRESLEVDEWKLRDPIDTFKTMSMDDGLITAEEIDRIDEEVNNTIDEAVRFAEESPEPDLDSLYENVYA